MSKLVRIDGDTWTVICRECHKTENFRGEDGEQSAREEGWWPRRSMITNKFGWTCPNCCAMEDGWATVAIHHGYATNFAVRAFQLVMAELREES